MPSMDTTFSYQVRVAACDRCGAPLEVSVAGGTFACRFCHAQNQVASRDEALVAPPRPPVPEHERIARLRMQDGKPLLPPPSIAHLVPGGQLAEWKVEEAVAVWNGARAELRAQRGNYEAAERLVFLMMVLAQHFRTKNELLRQRALLEGTLDVVSLPRHRQIVRGYLSRAAVRAHDYQAAEAWLAPCDPASDDLQMDSSYRFSRAFIDTGKGDFQRVLQILGPGSHDVPIEDACDDVCAVFRANAWEKMGRPDQAVGLLRERMQAGGGVGRQVIQQVIQSYADWGLCAASYAQAAQGHAVVAGRAAAQRASGGIHVIFVPLGALMFIGGIVAIGSVILGALGILDINEAAYAGIGITGGTFLFMGVVFGGIGLAMKKSAEKAAWLRVHGIQATAKVQQVMPTGLEINNVPQLRFTLIVEIPGRPPYPAQATSLRVGGLGAAMMPGASVPVRVHPQNPQDLILELD